DAHNFEEISIGDFVLTGGELAAYIVMDACIRLLPDGVGNPETPDEESFSDGLLEYPHYTRPSQWTNSTGTTHPVPDILLSGHHGNIAKWRLAQSKNLTKERRPDLFKVFLDKKPLKF
ncbi:MAG: tRNA (guanosine(37)-N1)-methyltransferase TrmD, partial [Pseudomonadota bacterium]